MEWMTNEEFLCYKVLKYLNDNRKEDGISLTEMLTTFQLTNSESLAEKIRGILIGNGLMIRYKTNYKISLLGEERYNLIHKQIEKTNEISLIDNKIKELTIENYNDRWKMFRYGSISSFIVAILSGLLVWLMTTKDQEEPIQTKTEIMNIPKVVILRDTIYIKQKESLKNNHATLSPAPNLKLSASQPTHLNH